MGEYKNAVIYFKPFMKRCDLEGKILKFEQYIKSAEAKVFEDFFVFLKALKAKGNRRLYTFFRENTVRIDCIEICYRSI